MFDIAIAKSISCWWIDFHLCLFGRLFLLKQCLCLFFVYFDKQIQDYLCFTLFFLQQPAIYAVLLLQGNFWILDFSAQHTFFIQYYSKHLINTGGNMFKLCKCQYLNMENITWTYVWMERVYAKHVLQENIFKFSTCRYLNMSNIA